MKGLIDPDTTRIESLRGGLHFLQGLCIVDIVGLPLEVPVFADNDARVALAGEIVWGAARGRENVLMLTLGNDPRTSDTSCVPSSPGQAGVPAARSRYRYLQTQRNLHRE